MKNNNSCEIYIYNIVWCYVNYSFGGNTIIAATITN